MLRTLFYLLLIFNLFAGAALLGFLGHSQPPGEPERLTNQLNPERIKSRLSAPAPVAIEQALPQTPPVSSTPDPQPATTAVVVPPAVEPAGPVSEPPAVTESATVAESRPPPKETPPVDPRMALACLRYPQLTPEYAKVVLARVRRETPALRFEETSAEQVRDWWVNIPPSKNREDADRKVGQLRQSGVQDYFVVRDEGPTQFAISLGVFKTETAARRYLEQLQGKGVRDARVVPRSTVNHVIVLRGAQRDLDRLRQSVLSVNNSLRTEGCQ